MATKGINKVIIVGNLGNDPEVRYTPAGAAITNISVATSESWKDKSTGQMQEKAEWHRIVFFGKLAEIAGEYLKKGSQVYIEGKLQTKKWQDKAGADRYTTEIIVDSFNGVMQMLGSKQEAQQGGSFTDGNGGGGGGYMPNGQPVNPQQQQQQPQRTQGQIQQAQQQVGTYQQQAQPAQGGDFDNSFDDDIPF